MSVLGEGIQPFAPENTCVLKYEPASTLKTHVFEDKDPRRRNLGLRPQEHVCF